jgi:RNase H-fold protein (predicted Holliday junction resolvase)
MDETFHGLWSAVHRRGAIMRILAVDHGEKRIGLALSDPTATIASPLKVIKHVSRIIDAAQVADIAAQNEVGFDRCRAIV